MKNEGEVNFQHRSGLVIEGISVIVNPIRLGSTVLPEHTKFSAEDGDEYFLSHLYDHAVTSRGWIMKISPEHQRWSMHHYNILHEVQGTIGIAVIRLYKPEYSMGIDSDVEFAIFGHVQIEQEFQGRGFGLPTYVAVQTILPERYRLAKTNNAKRTSRIIWGHLDDAGLVDTSTVVESATLVKPPEIFLRALRNK